MQKLLNEKDSMLKNLSNEFNVSSSIRYSGELCHIDSFTTEKELRKNPSPEPTPYTLDILDVWTPTDEPNTFFERALCVET